MADNLAQYRNRIRRYLRETNPDTSFWTDTFINQLFNACYRRRCAQLTMTFEGYFTIIALRDLTADKDRYAWPSGFTRLTKIELVRTDSSTVPLKRFERHDEVNHPTNAGEDDQYTPTYRPIGNGFVLEPTPQSTVTNGLRIEYVGVPTELSADNDEMHPSFPETLDELVVLDTAVAALYAEGLHEMGPSRALMKMVEDWEWDWQRFIDQRVVSRTGVDPFIPHYEDA